jgi:hypothetical protein
VDDDKKADKDQDDQKKKDVQYQTEELKRSRDDDSEKR